MADLLNNMLRIMDEAETVFRPAITETIAAAMDELATEIRTGYVSYNLSQPARNAITLRLSELWLATTAASVHVMHEEFKAGFPSLETKANVDAEIRRITDQYVGQYGAERAANIIRTTEQQVQSLVRGGMARGEATDTVFSGLVNKIPAMAEFRADIITRTESHAVSQYASQIMAERSAISLSKAWRTAGDLRVRDFGFSGRVSNFNHRIMNGQEVGLHQAFQIPTLNGGVERLLFPGDPAGSAGNVINCRCVQTYQRIE